MCTGKLFEQPANDNLEQDHCSSGAATPAKNWFAVFVTPRHEKRVDEHCRVRGIESFLPLFQTQSHWKDGSKRVLQLPLFPSYIFVRLGSSGRASVLQVPGVILIVGGGRQQLPVPDTYIHFLREGLRQGRIEPHPYVTVGARVRIRSGVMAGMEGMLICKKNKFRVVLTLDVIMKSATVEVAIGDIEPVGRAAASHLSQMAVHA
jgi:transcription antitermination factor NusG